MKLDTKTLNVLKSFTPINPSILIKEGNIVSTISPTKTVLAKAKVPTNFTKRFAIYDLSQFISTISLVEDPEFEFNNDHVKFSGTNGVFGVYKYASESIIKTPPEKELKLPTVDVSLKITENVLREIIRACGAQKVSDICIVGDGTNISIQALDAKESAGNYFNINIGTTDKVYRAVFKLDNIVKVIPGNYSVDISSKGISHFQSDEIEYWIAIESTSTF